MSSRKPPSGSGDWDDFDIPTWDDSIPSTPRRRASPSGPTRSSSQSRRAYPDPLYDDYDQPAPPTRQSPRPSSRTQAQPPTRLSSRVPTRTTRPAQDPYRDPYSAPVDPYVDDPFYAEQQYPSAPPERPAAASQYDLYADPALDVDWDGAPAYEEVEVPRRRRTSRQRTRSQRPSVNISRPAISDVPVASIVGVALLGLLIMSGVIWWGIADLAEVIPWHLNASGDVDTWASNTTLWRIPFGVFMTLAIGLAIGGYLWKRDRFAARFIITSMCIVQLLAWVAVIDQLW